MNELSRQSQSLAQRAARLARIPIWQFLPRVEKLHPIQVGVAPPLGEPLPLPWILEGSLNISNSINSPIPIDMGVTKKVKFGVNPLK